ncbi:uncharacterized protein LOC127857867 isoform X1 [Dreissena polymorpha]|uniref:Uncharacterized protein n=1 Tax=Dreissena polymorpha TaxID=45954 RepID=A0A9D4BSQ4_DREPO|nr:uncharacterized protein LOC127857867 isoform X1 [Dreissena polymorpha]XP_052250527.1 uncharacterized protein LOC127857867 isoform X1 [Dreissena polymorpha]KAH3706894.1 hypothetical protein DPMN_066285 [Dreissena polymorpha]
MSIDCRRSFESWRVYPRVHYFRKRFLDLYPRFQRVIGSLPFNINSDLIGKIDEAFKWYQNDLEIVYIENAFLPRENTFVDLNADLQSTRSATGSQVILCYVQGQSINENFIQILGHFIDYLHNVNASEPLVWIVDLANRPSGSEQEFVTSYINTKKEVISRVIFGSGQLEIATTISDYIEENLADILGLIVYCLLSVGTVHAKDTDVNVNDYLHKGLFQSAMNAYKLEHKTADKAIAEKMETGEELLPRNIHAVHKSSAEMALDEKHLSMLLRCNVLIPYSVHKYGIPAKIVNLILDAIDYEELFVKYLSQNSKDAILQSCSIPHKLHNLTCVTLGEGIIKDMSTVIQDLNAKCETTNQTITVMKKMLFEVNSYLEQTTFGDDVNWISKPPNCTTKFEEGFIKVGRSFLHWNSLQQFHDLFKTRTRCETYSGERSKKS